MFAALKSIVRSEQGATAIEYGLIAALIVIVMVGALSSMSGTTIGIWNGVTSDVVEATE